ncbi:MAG: glycoside hydrolase family 38 C-terminal domain-containing protein, partial [Candidatus Helarchaeota archaeon]
AVKKERKKFGLIKGELIYPPWVFPGCYSSRIKVKHQLRTLENLLYSSELLATITNILGKAYPYHALQEAWICLIKNDFHDACNGCGIDPSYINVMRRMRLGKRIAKKIQTESLNYLVGQINTEGDGHPIIVFNQLCWERSDLVEINLEIEELEKKFELKDNNGEIVPYQIVEGKNGNKSLIFIAENIPPIGYKIYFLLKTDKESDFVNNFKISNENKEKVIVENEIYKIVFENCLISKILNKKIGFEISRDENGINEVIFQNEKGDSYYINRSDKIFRPINYDLEIIEKGPVRLTVRVSCELKRKIDAKRGIKILQDIILYNNSINRIDFKTNISNEIKRFRLQTCFPTNINGAKIHSEVPYGFVERDILPNEGKSWAETAPNFEYYDRIKPVLNWTDISNDDFGVGILNFGIPEQEIGREKNKVYLTLLRIFGRVAFFGAGPGIAAGFFPVPLAFEIGEYNSNYAIILHRNNFEKSNVPRAAWGFNNPFIVKRLDSHKGKLPQNYNFISIEPNNVIITAVKRGEKGGVLCRFFETHGSIIKNGNLTINGTIKNAVEVNLIEKEIKELEIAGQSLKFNSKPQEIKSILFNF